MTEPTPLNDQAARDHLTSAFVTPAVVIAGAGSGKTHTLVQRVAGELTKPAPLAPSNLAAITFTERAARELTHRLRAAAPGVDLDDAYIGTIHGFCLRILRRYPIEAGLPPVFDSVDEIASRTHAAARAARMVDTLYDASTNNASLAEALAFLARELTAQHLNTLAAAIDREWSKFVDVPLPSTTPTAALTATIANDLAALRGVLQLDAVRSSDDTLMTRLRDDVAPWVDDVLARPFGSAVGQVHNVGRAGKAAAWEGTGWAKADVVAIVKQVVGSPRANSEPDNPTVADRVRREALLRVLHELTPMAIAAAQERISAGVVTYDDLLVLTDRLLATNPAIRGDVRAWFTQIYVDEYQDTDNIQHSILTSLTSTQPDDTSSTPPATLFIVGDPKQAIYSFRDATPDILVALSEHGDIVHKLTSNFRTRPDICTWINTVLTPRFAGDGGDLQTAYDDLVAVRTANNPAHAAVTLFGTRPDGTCVKHTSADHAGEAEATDIAAFITEITNDPSWTVTADDATAATRPATYGDITILVQTRTPLPTLIPALQRANIPHRVEGGVSLYDNRDVYELLRVLRVLERPEDAHRLVTALRTSLFGLDDTQLLAYHRVSGAWRLSNDHLTRMRDIGAEPDVVTALSMLNDWVDVAHLCDPARLASDIYEATLGRAASYHADGLAADETWRAVRFFFDEARAWSDGHGGTLTEYLAWVDARITAESRAVLATDETADAVRVMTIHASKGLEFPIAIVAGLGRGARSPAPVDVDLVNGELSARLTTKYQVGPIEDDATDRVLAEEARLLYVALTRAKDYLAVSLHSTSRGTNAARRLSAALASTTSPVPVNYFTAPDIAPDTAANATPCGGTHADTAASTHIEPPSQASFPQPVRPDVAARRLWTPSSISSLIANHAKVDPGLAKDPTLSTGPSQSRGRYGTAIGTAVHAVLQDVDLADPTDRLTQRCRSATERADLPADRTPVVEQLVRSVLDAQRFTELSANPAATQREVYVGTELAPDDGAGPLVVWGYIDAMYRRPDGRLTIIDFKTDASTTSVTELADRYRYQLSAYAVAVERSTGLEIAEALLLVAQRSGAPAIEVPIHVLSADELTAAIVAARADTTP